jgi:REP element-mobilizing transposase RayT
MPRIPRREVVSPSEVAVYHCVNRCVRRAFLCGRDPITGASFEHRREWIRARLEVLAGEFGIEVLGFAVMSNHLHVILRSRPDVVAEWSDDEVARRWWNIFPKRREADGSPAEPTESELRVLQADAKKCAAIRQRLSDVSWFMRCVAEPIARQANKEDNCKGHFWEGRFKCQPLLDEAAITACAVYVDLNPIRAGIARTPESSEFTSAHERIHAKQPRKHRANAPHHRRDGWLSPVPLDEPRGKLKDVKRPRRRASHKGFLPLSKEQYLQLVDWTGRQVRRDKRGAIPSDLAPILERLQLSQETWVETVQHFGRWFHRAAGSPASLAKEAERRGVNWLGGISKSREVFCSPG